MPAPTSHIDALLFEDEPFPLEFASMDEEFAVTIDNDEDEEEEDRLLAALPDVLDKLAPELLTQPVVNWSLTPRSRPPPTVSSVPSALHWIPPSPSPPSSSSPSPPPPQPQPQQQQQQQQLARVPPRAPARSKTRATTKKAKTTATTLTQQRKTEIERKSRAKRKNNLVQEWARIREMEDHLLHRLQQLQAQCAPRDRYAAVFAHWRACAKEIAALKYGNLALTEHLEAYVSSMDTVLATLHMLRKDWTPTRSPGSLWKVGMPDRDVHELKSWWVTPSDDALHELALSSLQEMDRFKFRKCRVTRGECMGWKVTSQLASDEVEFSMAKSFMGVNIETLAQNVWDARCQTDVATQLGAGTIQVQIGLVHEVNKNMLVMHRTLTPRNHQWVIRTLYLLFRVHRGSQIVIVSRELGHSHDLHFNPKTHQRPETHDETWVDCFTWTTFTPIVTDSDDGSPAVYEIDYAGWWKTGFQLGVAQWMQEMLIMVLRWESLFVAPVFRAIIA